MRIFNFLRFRARPPSLGLPPKNCIDAWHDPETGEIRARNDRGESVKFDGSGGSTDDLTTSNGASAAAAAALGEYLSNEGSAVLTNYTAATIATITVTPGEWDVEGLFYLSPDSASISLCTSGISTNASTPSGFPNHRSDYLRTTADSDSHFITPPKRRFLATTNTILRLVVVVSFSEGSVEATGHLRARRVR